MIRTAMMLERKLQRCLESIYIYAYNVWMIKTAMMLEFKETYFGRYLLVFKSWTNDITQL